MSIPKKRSKKKQSNNKATNDAIGFWLPIFALALTLNAFFVLYQLTGTATEEAESIPISSPDLTVLFDTAVPYWSGIQDQVNELGMNGGGAIIGTSDEKIAYIWCSNEFSCLHEVGHAMHRFFRVDEALFGMAIETYAKDIRAFGCTNRGDYERSFECFLSHYPGLLGNNYRVEENGGDTWGRYGELYASAYAHWKSNDFTLPDELLHFWTNQPTINKE